jgi:hypothetical protein
MENITPKLERALRTASDRRLRIILYTLCETDKHVNAKVSDLLLADTSKDSAASNGKNTTTSVVEQKRQRYEICSNCAEEYEFELNDSNSCIYHPGEHST